jgi:carbonic anhydrase
MSCPNSTSPVDIPTIGTTCSLKCNFSHKYPSSELYVTHNGDYISIKLNSSVQSQPVEYGNSTYDVEDIRLYMYSLHTYVGEKAHGEMIIIHRNNMGGEKLLVCVPFMVNENAGNDTSIAFDNVVSEIGRRANSNGSQTQINLATFNLNKFIPKKPFIIYNGTLPFSPCEKTKVDYVVFRKEDAIPITLSSAELLFKLIKRTNYDIKGRPSNGFFFNKNGPKVGTSTSDDIYIDCKPTGSDGETIQVPSAASSWNLSADTMNLSKVGMAIGLLVGMIIMYLLIKMLTYGLNALKIGQSVNFTSGAGPAAAAVGSTVKK